MEAACSSLCVSYNTILVWYNVCNYVIMLILLGCTYSGDWEDTNGKLLYLGVSIGQSLFLLFFIIFA